MREALERIEREFADALAAAGDEAASIEAVRVRYLGRKGEVTGLMKQLGGLPAAEKPAAGQSINALKRRIQSAIEDAAARAEQQAVHRELERESDDISLPPRANWSGSLHPLTHTRREMESLPAPEPKETSRSRSPG